MPKDFLLSSMECDNLSLMSKRLTAKLCFCFLGIVLAQPLCVTAQSQKRAPEYTFKVVHTFPHDSSAFTQGLAYQDGFLYEGTGLKGRSSLRKVRLETGEVIQQIELSSEYFGEG